MHLGFQRRNYLTISSEGTYASYATLIPGRSENLCAPRQSLRTAAIFPVCNSMVRQSGITSEGRAIGVPEMKSIIHLATTNRKKQAVNVFEHSCAWYRAMGADRFSIVAADVAGGADFEPGQRKAAFCTLQKFCSRSPRTENSFAHSTHRIARPQTCCYRHSKS